MATKVQTIDVNTLDSDLTIKSSTKNTSLYLKNLNDINALSITGANIGNDLTLTVNGHNIILKDYFAKNGAFPIKKIKTDSDETPSINIINYVNANYIHGAKQNMAGGVAKSITGTIFDDTIVAGAKKQTIDAGKGNDKIYSGPGNDTITGGEGIDTIVYKYEEEGDKFGKDKINLTKGETLNIDIVDGSYDPIALAFSKDGDNLVIKNAQVDTDSITIKDYYGKETGATVYINGKNLATTHNDDFNFDEKNISKATLTGSALADVIDATNAPQQKSKGKVVNLAINGGAGNDVITGSQFKDTIKAGSGDDTINGSLSADTITGGKGQNTIKYTSLAQLEGDKINLTKGENVVIDVSAIPSATASYKVSGKDLVVTVTDGLNPTSFKIVNFGTTDVTNNKTATTADTSSVLLKLSDTTTVDLREAMVSSSTGTYHNDIINAWDSKKGVTVSGGKGNDRIIGSSYNDTLKAGTGTNDYIDGGKGKDNLYASTTKNSNTIFFFAVGDGKDTVYSGKGVDELLFDEGISLENMTFTRGKKTAKNDLTIKYSDKDTVTIKDFYAKTNTIKKITTSEGTFNITDAMDPNKIIKGTGDVTGTDESNIIFARGEGGTIHAGGGDDTVIVNSNGNNTIYLESGNNDLQIIGNGKNTVYGGTGDDYIVAGDGDDTINLNNGGNNTVYLQEGANKVYGGEGVDTISAGTGNDEIHAGAGNDKINLSMGGNNTVYLESGTNEITKGGAGVDTIYAGTGNDIIRAGAGNDKIDLSKGGSNTVYLESGNNEITKGGTGVDIIYAGTGNDIIRAGAGNDKIDLSKGGNNTVYLESGYNEITKGGAGADIIYGGAGNDIIRVGAGDDTIDLSKGGMNTVYLESGNNEITKGSYNIDKIYGGTGNDTIYAGSGNDVIDMSKGGTNTVYGEAGNDTITGGAGNDTINGGVGNDTMNGGAGNDTFVFQEADGVDTIIKGSGNDTIEFDKKYSLKFSRDMTTAPNDLVITYAAYNSKVVLQNYFVEDNHSVQTIKNGTEVLSVDSALDQYGFEVTGSTGKDTIYGRDGNDILNGNNGDDIIYGRGGNDTIRGNAGIDALYGEEGPDSLYGGDGNDYIDGGIGDDQIYGEAGNDTIIGGAGIDYIEGGAGVDNISGEAGDDVILGGEGDDTIFGGDGKDSISGETGDDYIDGGDGDDTLNGNEGADTIYAGAGNDYAYGGDDGDTIYGDDGDDRLYGEAGNDWLYGGAGIDRIYGGAGDDYIEGNEGNDIIEGSDGADTIHGNDGNDSISGGAGDDYIMGDDGDDTIYGDDGDDTLYGDAGKDTIYGGNNNDIIYGEADNDTIEGGNGDDFIYGGDGADTLKGGDGADNIEGGAGNDYIYGGDGADTLKGDAGDDYIEGGAGNDYIYGNGGNDTLYGQDGNDIIIGDEGNDTIYGGSGNDYLYGDDGADRIEGGDGNDRIEGGDGNDTIYGGNDNDNIQGGDGDDVIYGDDGNDLIMGGDGDDVIYGDAGDDTIYGDGGLDYIDAGAGTNTIYIGSDDYVDHIYSGGGTDTLIFTGATSINDMDASLFEDDDTYILNIVPSQTNTNGASLLDYNLSSGHSVQNIKIGYSDTVYSVNDIKHHINSSENTVNGTAWHDDIYTTGDWAEVYAGAGNDVIHITNASKYPAVYVGAGSDTVSLEAAKSSVDIYFEEDDGSNTLSGLSNVTDTSTYICLVSTTLFNSVPAAGKDWSLYEYLEGTNDGNDLVLNLTSGETFRIKDYNNVDSGIQDTIYVSYGLGAVRLKDYLKLTEDIVNIEEDADVYTVAANNKLVIAPNVTTARTITINANNDTLVLNGSNSQAILVNGDNATVWVNNPGNIKDVDRNIVVVSGDNSDMFLYGANKSTVTYNDNISGEIYIGGGKGNSVTTSAGGNVDVVIDPVESEWQYVVSKGTDDIRIHNSVGEISLYGDYQKEIYVYNDANVYILNAANVQHTAVYKGIYSAPNEIMFSHYANARSGDNNDVDLLYRKANGAICYADVNFRGTWIKDAYGADDYFDLDTMDFSNKTYIELNYSAENTSMSQSLSDMTQYVNMYNGNVEEVAGGYKHFGIHTTDADDGIFSIAKDVYIEGTSGKDMYTVDRTNVLDKQYTISDGGGDADWLSITGEEADAENFRFFFDVDTSGNIVGKDLYIMSMNDGGTGTSPLDSFLRHNDRSVNYICIKDYFDGEGGFGTGKIEYIEDAGGYLLQDDLFENIAADVAGWLNDRNGHNGHYYDTIMEAMEDTDYFINKTLVGQYTTEESFGDSGQPPEYWSNFWL